MSRLSVIRKVTTDEKLSTSMAPPTAEDIITHALKVLENSPQVRRDVLALKSEGEIFDYAEQFINNGFPDYAPNIRFEGKNLERTKELVGHGVGYLAVQRHSKALEVFNEAILLSPWRTRETPKEEAEFCVAAVFGHRATALFHMKRFAECIVDIHQAFGLECPAELKESLVLLKAKLFLALKRPEEAVYALVNEADVLHVSRHLLLLEEGGNLDARDQQYSSLLASAEREKAKALKKNQQHKLPPEPLKPKHPTYLDMLEEVKKLNLTKYGINKDLPCASAGIILKSEEEFVSHFVAEKEFSIGDVVLVEPSFVSYLRTTTSGLTQYCFACCLYTETPFPCRKCSLIVYCSPACASGPKGAIHARECSFWKTLVINAHPRCSDEPVPGNANMAVIMAMRVILMKTPQFWNYYCTRAAAAGTAAETMSSLDVIPELEGAVGLTGSLESMGIWMLKKGRRHCRDVLFSIACASVLAMKVLDQVYFIGEKAISEALRKYLGGLLVHFALQLSTNWFGAEEIDMKASVVVSEDHAQGVAAAVIHPAGSLLKNSCNPNLFMWHYADMLVVTASRPVKPGEVLCLNKIGFYPDRNLEIRQEAARQLGFRCSCQPCVENWPGAQELSAMFARGFYRVRCIGCSHVFDARAGDGPGQKCPQCGRKFGEWLLAYKALIGKLFPKGMQFGAFWSGPKDTRPLLPYFEQLFQLCAEPSFPVTYFSNLIDSWFRKQSMDVTHPGRKSGKPGMKRYPRVHAPAL